MTTEMVVIPSSIEHYIEWEATILDLEVLQEISQWQV